MTKKVTQQQIANALQLSRNTVSKALNNEPGLKEDTRAMIIQQAVAMGYTKFPQDMLMAIQDAKPQYQELATSSGNRLIALLTHSEYVGNHYWSPFIRGLNASLKDFGYTVAMTLIDEQEEDMLQLPSLFAQQTPAGIITIGSFLRAYYERIESTGIPGLFVDTYADFRMNDIQTDILLVNNRESVYELTKNLVSQGYREIGFIGDVGSCLSYKERWEGYQQALAELNIPLKPEFHIVNHLPRHYYEGLELRNSVQQLEKLPRAFVCANDAIAVEMILILREMGLRVPEDVALTGFDNIGELTYLQPMTPTVDVPKEEMGLRAGEQLIWRIANPSRPKEIIRMGVQVHPKRSDN